MSPPLPLEACVGRMKPEVRAKADLGGGRRAPTELPLLEDLEAGSRTSGLDRGLVGAGFTGQGGARFTVATDTELFNELLELLKDALEVDLSTLKELVRFGMARFGSTGVRGRVLKSLAVLFFGTSGVFVILGTGEWHSTLQPEEAPCEALSELRLCVSSKPSSFNSCSDFTLVIFGEVVRSGTFSALAFNGFL